MSLASYSWPVFFVKKLGDGIKFYVNYKKLSVITKKDCYLIPLIEETLIELEGAKYFIKINIVIYQIKMSKDSKELTTFLIRYGAFKYWIMPFSLCNGLTS